MIYILGGGEQCYHIWKDAAKGQKDSWWALIVAAAAAKRSDGASSSLQDQRDRADAWMLALCATLEEVTQRDFDALSWVTDLVSQTAGLSGRAHCDLVP